MKWLIPILLILLAGLQYRLWVGEGSLADVVRLNEEIKTQSLENDRLRERNRVLATEVKGLKSGIDAVEERAREDLGMIKPDETFFMVVDPSEKK
ncbi:cell division protein FtsB [Aestuariicella sp. G3-2]|uniref:cell division protein FtsB n=1 Tax=Pseudomaricurvus albidus TaxID=2842452 RepID=UPI001C0B427F|nr:cell division protein FtsB [Aestuariicella albida]MBU3070225.1 cell division protein FtsB [Aestuariicella albida]